MTSWGRGFQIHHSTLMAVISLFDWPTQIIQSSAGGFPSNHVECLTSHNQPTKTRNQLSLANTNNKHTRQPSSSPVAWSSAGSHTCQPEPSGTADHTVFVSRWCNACSNPIDTTNFQKVQDRLYKYPAIQSEPDGAGPVDKRPSDDQLHHSGINSGKSAVAARRNPPQLTSSSPQVPK